MAVVHADAAAGTPWCSTVPTGIEAVPGAGTSNRRPPGPSGVLHVPTYGSISRGRCLIADLAGHPQIGHPSTLGDRLPGPRPSRRLANGRFMCSSCGGRTTDSGLDFRPDAHGAEGVVHHVLAFSGEEPGLTGGRTTGRNPVTGIAVDVRAPKEIGRCWMALLSDVSGASLSVFVTGHVEPGALVITDATAGWRGSAMPTTGPASGPSVPAVRVPASCCPQCIGSPRSPGDGCWAPISP
jgi:hypothetical protein